MGSLLSYLACPALTLCLSLPLHPISHHAALPSSHAQQRVLEGEMPLLVFLCRRRGWHSAEAVTSFADFLTVHLESANI